MDKKDNTGLIIVIIVGLLIVIGIIGYMMMSSKPDKTDNVIEEQTEQTEAITNNDVAGTYKGTFDADDNIVDNIEEETKEIADDVKDAITSDKDKKEEDENYTIEVELNQDGSARLVNTKNSKEIISGSYTIDNKTITFTGANDGTDEDTPDTYMFTYTDDNNLTYDHSGNTVTLKKVGISELKYIS